jgi:hypothetical protein
MLQPAHLTTREIPAINLPTLPELPLPETPAVVVPSSGVFGSITVRLMLVFLGVFMAGMTLALGQARNSADDMAAALNELLTPPQGCSMPCWQGIQPNATTADEAVAILEALPYVDDVQVSPSMISWWWTSDRPLVYDAAGRAFDGRIEVGMVNGEQRVTAIVLLTTLQLGQIQLALGDPDSITLYTVHPEDANRRDGVVHLAHYGDVTVFNILQCPMTVEHFWRSPSYVAFGSPTLVFEGDTYEVEELPGWFFRDEAPGCA